MFSSPAKRSWFSRFNLFARRTELAASRRSGASRPSFRPSLECLERRELLSATGLEPVQIQVPVFHGDASVAASNAAHLGLTPDQIRHAYGFDNIRFNNGSIPGDGRGQTIAIIETSDDPNIAQDAEVFNADPANNLPQFNSPGGPTLKVEALHYTNADGSQVYPEVDPSGGGDLETALDVEWAHAIAPEANIMIVEAPVALQRNPNLPNYGGWSPSESIWGYVSAHWAAQQPGVSVVSMSFGGSYVAERNDYNNDGYFLTPQGHNGVTFVASAGDDGVFEYPAASQNVLGVGGTTLTLSPSGNYGSETVWNDGDLESGGGPDPAYDTGKPGPDVALNAAHFSIYNSDGGGWEVARGTSGSAPVWAGLIAIADQGRALDGLGSLYGASQTLPMIHNMSSWAFHTNLPGRIDYNFKFNDGSVEHFSYSGSDVVGRGTPYADRVVSLLSGQPIYAPPSNPQPPSAPPAAAPTPYDRVAADAQSLVQSYESGNIAGVYAALMDFESLLFNSPGTSPVALEEAFLNDIFADL